MGIHYVVFHDNIIKGIYDKSHDALIVAKKEFDEDEAYTCVVKFYDGTKRVKIFEKLEDGTTYEHFENIEI